MSLAPRQCGMLLRDHIIFALRVINGELLNSTRNNISKEGSERFSWKFTERTSDEESERENADRL